MELVETVIIGGGQAGLAMSYHLRRLGQEHVVVERGQVGERWRMQRWDSLMFQFPNWSIELPGYRYAGDAPDAFSHKEEIVKLIEEYCALIRAPLRTAVTVRSLRAAPRPSRYILVTDQGDIEARNVVIATGPYQRPRIPSLAALIPGEFLQIHASEYRNAARLPPGAVLVVGTGASGCQIAEELLDAGRRVYLSVGRHRRIPRRYRGRDVFWWRRELGHLDATAETTPRVRRMPAPLVTGIRRGHDINLRQFAANGMTLLGHLRDIRDTQFGLAPDLEDSLTKGDQACDEFKRAVDEYVRKAGLEAPRTQSNEQAGHIRDRQKPVEEFDLRAAGIGTVLWATGYQLDLGWVELPIFDELGEPVHRRGVTAVPGIYFLGLAWLHKQKSSFLYGVGEDAEYLADRICTTSRGELPATASATVFPRRVKDDA
jgi:putative flavoprotein involved in K+ transport